MNDNVVVGWRGLPLYAARLIKAADGQFPIVATRPKVPILGMDRELPQRIHWIPDDYNGGWAGLELSVPKLYFQPSWGLAAFNRLGDEVCRAGGKVVVMFDNPWRGDLRQLLGALKFRTLWRRRFVAAWVAGASGRRLASYWGFARDDIYEGMYGADPALFSGSEIMPLSKRPRRFIFVARLVEAKGVRELLTAWHLFIKSHPHPDWELCIYGVGPLEELVRADPSVKFFGFQQPEQIAAAMLEARFLVLPSYLEHWGLVVCEAAQAGCGLLLSRTVGSRLDLAGDFTELAYKPKDPHSLCSALARAANLSESELSHLQACARRTGMCFTPE